MLFSPPAPSFSHCPQDAPGPSQPRARCGCVIHPSLNHGPSSSPCWGHCGPAGAADTGSRMLPARERAEEGRPPHQRRDRERPAARSWPWPWTRPAGICRLHPPPEFHWLWELSTPHPWRKEVFLPGAHRSGSWSRRTPRGPTKWHECRDVPATGEDQGSSRSQRGPGEPPVYKRLG